MTSFGSRFNPAGTPMVTLLLCLLLSVGISACVTGTASTPTVPTVALQVLPAAALQTGSQTQLVAAVSNDSKSLGIDWIASCQSTACGTFNPAHTASGVPTVYTAPTVVPQGCVTGSGPAPCVNLTARATAVPSQTSTVSVSIFSAVAVTLTGFPASPLGAGNSTSVTAVVTGDPNNPPLGVSWTLSCSVANCGTIPTNTLSGVAATYTAPASVASSFVVTLQANAVAAPSQFVTTSITITPGTQASVAFSTPPTSPALAGATENIIATVSNDPNNEGVDWTVTCNNSAGGGCGTFNPGAPAHTASGAVMVYTAPSQVPAAGLQVTIQAAPTANPSAAISASVTVNTPALSITFTEQPPTSLVVGATAQMSANVLNDNANPPNGVNWSVSCTAATGGNCGSFSVSPAHTADKAVITYTAPAVIPANNSVTITATSSADSTKFVSQNVTIQPSTATTLTFTTAPPSTMIEDATVNIVATVTNDSTTPPNGVNWTVTCTAGTGGDCGSFSAAHTASGVATTYTAPTILPANGAVTITATSAAQASATVSQNITITTPLIAVTFSLAPPNSIPVGTTVPITANVANDSPTHPNGVNWSCTASDGGNCGSFNPTSTPSGTATAYTAPSAIPGNGGTVTITATSAADPTKSVASSPISITPDQDLGLLNGQYALSLSGASSSGYYGLAGSIIADGKGNITGGEEDLAGGFCGPQTSTSISGTYAIGSDGRGTMTLQTGVSCFDPSNNGIQTFSFVIVGSPTTGSPRALIVEFDNSSSSGRLDLQDTTDLAKGSSAISGAYAFTFKGFDVNNTNVNGISTADMGGLITVQAGNALNIAQDINNQGTGAVTKTTGSWTYTNPDSFGRATATNASSTESLTFYVVNIGQANFLEDDSEFVEAGSGFAQGTPSLSGPFAFTLFGVSGATTDLIDVGGVFTASGSNLSAGTIDINDAGTLMKNTALSGTFTAPTNGRGTITLTGSPGGLSSFAFYPTASNGVLMLELDTGFASVGAALPQSATPVFAAGTYGMNLTDAIAGGPVSEEDATGQVIASGSSFTGTVDINDNEGTGNSFPGTILTGSFGSTSATGRFTGSFSLPLTTTNTQTIQETFYVVDANPGPLTPANAVAGNITGSSPDATCAEQGSCVAFTLPAGTQTIGVTLGGTFAGATFALEESSDNVNWTAATCSSSNPLLVTCPPGIATHFRVRASALGSGTVAVTIIADTTETTFAPGESSSDPNTLTPVPACSPSGATLSSVLYFDTATAQLFYCSATNTWAQFTGVGPNTVLFVEMDASQSTGMLRLQSLP